MSPQSAMKSMTIENFRGGILFDYTRSSNLVSISSIKSGTANMETLECAALSIAPSPSSSLYSRTSVCGCLFDIIEDDLDPYVQREHRYAVEKVNVYDVNTDDTCEAITVVAQTDEQYRSSMDGQEYHERVGRYYQGQLWGRSDIYPLPMYTSNVIKAAYELGGDRWLNNFLGETFLCDGKTTLREYYCKLHPERLLPQGQQCIDVLDSNSRQS